MKRLPLLVLVTSLALAHGPGASAEVTDWAVVPATNGEMPPFMERVVADVTRELERHGRHVWPSDAAAARFQHRGSTAAVEITEDALEKWAQHSRAAVRALARGNHAMALNRLDRAELLSRGVTEELNRDPERAQRVLDTCLYRVRALLETNDAAGAESHASECVVLVPRGQPATFMHPPHVLALYQQAREHGLARAGSLVVESAPPGCSVRVNGVRLGETPLEITTLSVGEYGVQVECDRTRRGRVHSTKVGPGTTKRVVNARFDRTVRAEPILRLEYPKEGRSSWRVNDAREIAELLPAHTAVVVSAPTVNTIAVGLVSRMGSRQGCSLIAATADGPSREALAVAIRKLIDGRCGDLSASSRDPAALFKPGI
jgi:hypothetical protein